MPDIPGIIVQMLVSTGEHNKLSLDHKFQAKVGYLHAMMHAHTNLRTAMYYGMVIPESGLASMIRVHAVIEGKRNKYTCVIRAYLLIHDFIYTS